MADEKKDSGIIQTAILYSGIGCAIGAWLGMWIAQAQPQQPTGMFIMPTFKFMQTAMMLMFVGFGMATWLKYPRLYLDKIRYSLARVPTVTILLLTNTGMVVPTIKPYKDLIIFQKIKKAFLPISDIRWNFDGIGDGFFCHEECLLPLNPAAPKSKTPEDKQKVIGLNLDAIQKSKEKVAEEMSKEFGSPAPPIQMADGSIVQVQSGKMTKQDGTEIALGDVVFTPDDMFSALAPSKFVSSIDAVADAGFEAANAKVKQGQIILIGFAMLAVLIGVNIYLTYNISAGITAAYNLIGEKIESLKLVAETAANAFGISKGGTP